MQTLFTTTATALGGRNGHSASLDGTVSVNLSVPLSMGGPGLPHTTTPEHLFATGYAACFSGALDYVATLHHKNASTVVVTCNVSIGPRTKGGFGLAVQFIIEDDHLLSSDLNFLVQEAHEKICPYSHATRGNIPVDFIIRGI